MKDEVFKDWWEEERSCFRDPFVDQDAWDVEGAAESAWNYQQEKIQNLEAKLAEAVDLLKDNLCYSWLGLGDTNYNRKFNSERIDRARAFLKELEKKNDRT